MADADEDVDVQVAARFAHLLKPIRDLAENWGVDIANDLEDYLEHLNRTAFTFEGGPKLDFAEAALVIQSSACVYSRKVDFLHNLVYQALEAVRSKRSSNAEDEVDAAGIPEGGPTQRQRAARRDAASAEPEDDTIEGFLAAGMDLQQCDDIDLVSEDAPPATYIRPPAALMALEDQCSGTGEGDERFSRLAQCFVHISGVLLLDPNDADMYDQHLNNTGVKALSAWPDQQVQAAQLQGAGGAAAAQQKGNGGDEEDGQADGGGMSDDEDGQAAAVPAASQAATAAQQAASQLPAATLGGAPAASAAPAPTEQQQQDAYTLRHAAHSDHVGVAQRGVVEDEAEVFDVYKPLDMDGPGTLPIRPMQVKRPGRGKLKPVAVAQPTLAGAARALPKALANITLLNPQFAYGLQLLHQLHPPAPEAPRGRTTRAQAARGAGGEALVPVFDAADAAAVQADIQEHIEQQEAAVADAGAVWDDGGGGGAGGFDDDDDGGGGGGFDGGGLDIADLAGAELLEVPMRPAHAPEDDPYGDLSRGDEGPSYEELCRAHVDAMMAHAAAQEVQTELAVRVSGWRNKIDPVLKDEETRKGFDIQQYQAKIITTLDKKKQEDPVTHAQISIAVDFGNLATQHVKWEVSRTFAAMLQLINNRNVAIVHSGTPDAPFSLQLLNPELLHKTMGRRLAGGRGGPGTQAHADDDEQQGADEPMGEEGAVLEEGNHTAGHKDVNMHGGDRPDAGAENVSESSEAVKQRSRKKSRGRA